MMILDWIRFIAGALCILAGVVFNSIQLIGVFRFRYVLNRIHAAAIGDTLGCGLILFGVLILKGLDPANFKIVVLLLFLWVTTPVAAHMVGKLEVLSKESPEECCPVKDTGLSAVSQTGGKEEQK